MKKLINYAIFLNKKLAWQCSAQNGIQYIIMAILNSPFHYYLNVHRNIGPSATNTYKLATQASFNIQEYEFSRHNL